ncbi:MULTISPECIES: flagellar hook-associated protein FlgL [Shewanella]|uniref:flagellar hook-associated protein FlgL n=1 Tax=Shewanella TaxID=22 RepID=UPI000C3F5346|nr:MULTISPECIES: flagellar hook-associated protein FlgL [Shewanella]NCQ45524.1 flagellar hook-associated protein FlgL [Shewanella frigidimarina]NCO73425.1 flagellar hook-associated protein FlgL [Shewanella vesiculosa]NCP37572.1 flagellar hook-associated protein FlgL [Shewanella vesiculosa]NCP69302.1 flagellar hook-associated protein FlgL [Shewanella vesiculosa]NCP75193.1 flagellar hook-associated protein FlgL [Shewanella vesiculosa]
MRISTGQMFQQNTNSILEKQSATNTIMAQISSGKKVNTAGDDPVAAIGIDNLKQKNALVDQFVKNIDYATSHIQQAESQLGQADTLAGSMKESMLRGINGSMTSAERQVIADDMRQSLEQLMSIANTKDESGNYIFAGNKTNSAPFAFDNNGDVVYSGDAGIRKSNIAQGVQVNTNTPGDAAFMNAPNAMGDYRVNYLSTQQGDFVVTSAKITEPLTYTPDTYSFNFVDDGNGVMNLEVRDSAATLVTTVAPFDASLPVNVNGIEIQLDGEPAIGDTFTINEVAQVSIFDTFSKAIALFESGNDAQTPAGQSELAQLLNNIDSGVNQMSQQRSLTGNSLKVLQQYSDNHTDEKLINTSALSKLEDLDFASAITEFEKQQLALNAASSLFSKVSSTSLFDYI